MSKKQTEATNAKLREIHQQGGKPLYSIMQDLKRNTTSYMEQPKVPDAHVFKPLQVKSQRYKDRNITVGNTVFSFNKEGVATVLDQGNTVEDYKVVLRMVGMSKYPPVVKEVVADPVVVIEEPEVPEEVTVSVEELEIDEDFEEVEALLLEHAESVEADETISVAPAKKRGRPPKKQKEQGDNN